MGGSTSRQSTDQRSTQFGDAIGVSGTNIQATGDVIQQIPDNLALIFSNVVDVLGSTISGAGQLAQSSIEQVAVRSNYAENPSLASQTALTPLILGAVGIGALVLILPKILK